MTMIAISRKSERPELKTRGLSGGLPRFNFAPGVGFDQKAIEFEEPKPKS
jgi:hypothetical protein